MTRGKEPVRKEKSLRHFHVTTAVAQPSSCSVAHVYMLACSKQKAASEAAHLIQIVAQLTQRRKLVCIEVDYLNGLLHEWITVKKNSV